MPPRIVAPIGLGQPNPEARELSDDDCKVLKLGVAAFTKITKGAHREDWLRIGRSLNTLQAAAMAAAGTAHPIGVVYNHYYAYYAAKHRATGLAKLEKSIRSHAMWMAQNWPVVEAWLAALPEELRLKLNNPTTIHRRFDRDTNPPDPRVAPETPTARLVRVQDELDYVKVDRDALREENDALRVIAQRFLPPNMSVTEVAACICAECTAEQVAALIGALQAALADWPDDQPQPDAPEDRLVPL